MNNSIKTKIDNELNLSDLIDVPVVLSMMESFYSLTHIPMAIIDITGKVIVGVGWQDICTKFHRVHPETARNCHDSDIKLTSDIPEGEFRLYKCKNGMWDLATPLFFGGKRLGNLFTGQFFFADEKINYSFFANQAARFNFDETGYLQALNKVPCISRTDIDNAKTFFLTLANTLTRLGYNNRIVEDKLLRQTQELQIVNDALYAEMSERLKAELIAKNERKRLNDALELLPAYLILLTPDYQVPYANRFFRDRFGESGGKRCFEYLFGRTEPCEVCETYRTLKENRMVTWEWVGPDKHIYSIFDYPFKDTDGSPMIMEVGIDVTELKEAQLNLLSLNKELELRVAELLRSNTELEQFAQVASHDLQEPLRMVASYTQLLSKKYSGKLDANANDYINFAVEGAIRMQNLIIGLLDLSRIEKKGGPISRVDMNNALKIALNNLKIAIVESNAAVTSDILPSVMADELQAVRLFQNLIGNAIKFSERPPRINISSIQSNGNHVFSVSDNGIGIEPQYFEKIFRIFQRLMPRDKYDGTGIGLSICKKIVERHGGKIWVESKPGKGSTFKFSLPAATDKKTL